MSDSGKLPLLCGRFDWDSTENVCRTCGVGFNDTASAEKLYECAEGIQQNLMQVADKFIRAELALPPKLQGAWIAEFQSLFEAYHTCEVKFTPLECVAEMPDTREVVRLVENCKRDQQQVVIWVRVRQFSETGDRRPGAEVEDEEDAADERAARKHATSDPSHILAAPLQDDQGDDPDGEAEGDTKGDDEEEEEEEDDDDGEHRMVPRLTVDVCFPVSMVGWKKWHDAAADLLACADPDQPLSIVRS